MPPVGIFNMIKQKSKLNENITRPQREREIKAVSSIRITITDNKRNPKTSRRYLEFRISIKNKIYIE